MRARAALWMAGVLVVSVTWLIEGQPGSPREDAYRQNNLGVAHLERYNFRAAADAFRQALKIEPTLDHRQAQPGDRPALRWRA